MDDDTTWTAAQLRAAPTWLPRLSLFSDGASPRLFRDVVDRFRSLQHLSAPLAADDPTAQLEALAAKHGALRSLGLTTSTRGVRTAPLAALPIERAELSARLLRDADGVWSDGFVHAQNLLITARELTRLTRPDAWSGLHACTSLELLHVELDLPTARAIAQLPRLQRLNLRGCQPAPGALAALAASASLTRLTLSGAALPAADAAELANRGALEIAALSIGTAEDLRALRPLAKRGVALALSLLPRTHLGDELIAAICAELPGLAGLSLDQGQIVGLTKQLTPAGLAPIGRLIGLRWLSLDGIYVRKIKPAELGWLRGLGALRSLSLRNAGRLSASVVDELVGLQDLATLDLRTVALSDAAARRLGALPLRLLALSDVKLGDRGLAALAAIPTLTHLSIDHSSGYSDAMLAAFNRAHQLECLHLGACVTAETRPTDLGPLARLPRLRTLAIAEVGLSDAWLASLAGAPALQQLWLTRSDPSFSGGALSDAAVHAALAVPTLETLACWGFTPSPAALAAIEAAEHGAWVPGGHGRWLSIERPADAPLCA